MTVTGRRLTIDGKSDGQTSNPKARSLYSTFDERKLLTIAGRQVNEYRTVTELKEKVI